MNTLGVIILAAGASSRMGTPKLLLPWKKTTVIGHLISQWTALGAGQIVIVMRPNDKAMTEELDRLQFSPNFRVLNHEPQHGMFSSILCAARWPGWPGEITRFAIALGDQPHLQTETLRKLLHFSAMNLDAICQPAHNGRTAHPVILPKPIFSALKDTSAGTLKEFLKLVPGRSVQHVINDPGLTLDLDTPEDYILGLKLNKAA